MPAASNGGHRDQVESFASKSCQRHGLILGVKPLALRLLQALFQQLG